MKEFEVTTTGAKSTIKADGFRTNTCYGIEFFIGPETVALFDPKFLMSVIELKHRVKAE